MKEQQVLSVKRLKELLVRVPEHRRTTYGNYHYPLVDILAITLFCVVCGQSSWEDIYLYAQCNKVKLVKLLNLKNGIPSEYTIQRVIRSIRSDILESLYREWVTPYVGSLAGKHLAVDGKTCRGVERHGEKKLHTVNAWVTESGVSLGQKATNDKSNEITAIPELLDDLDIEGGIVSIDAMGCQKDIALNIRNNKADYILAVKQNHKNMYNDIAEYFAWAVNNPAEKRTIFVDNKRDYGHGRIVRWRVFVTKDVKCFDFAKDWKDLKAIVMVQATVECQGKQRVEARYYLSSLDVDAGIYLSRIREHWSVENSLHWVLDVQFKEDACLIHRGDAPKNLSILRKIAMALMKKVKKPGMSYHRIQVLASFDYDFAASVFV